MENIDKIDILIYTMNAPAIPDPSSLSRTGKALVTLDHISYGLASSADTVVFIQSSDLAG